jgi:hypothetical protein
VNSLTKIKDPLEELTVTVNGLHNTTRTTLNKDEMVSEEFPSTDKILPNLSS